MLIIGIPGFRQLKLEHLVLDFNGTIASGGKIRDGVKNRMNQLAGSLAIHVVTADTFGSVRSQLAGYPCKLHILGKDSQDQEKLRYLRQLGSEYTVCIGNGRNDCLMLREAILGICVSASEGAATGALLSADILCPDILSALDLLIHPKRLVATLRN